jgi:DNA end-binding protein Ku
MASRPRAYWKGYLRLSLVSIGVELYAATVSADSTALHQIHKPSGKRVRYEKVVPGLGPIEASDIVKGFEIGDDSYVVIEPEELEKIKLESSRSIECLREVLTLVAPILPRRRIQQLEKHFVDALEKCHGHPDRCRYPC